MKVRGKRSIWPTTTGDAPSGVFKPSPSVGQKHHVDAKTYAHSTSSRSKPASKSSKRHYSKNGGN